MLQRTIYSHYALDRRGCGVSPSQRAAAAATAAAAVSPPPPLSLTLPPLRSTVATDPVSIRQAPPPHRCRRCRRRQRGIAAALNSDAAADASGAFSAAQQRVAEPELAVVGDAAEAEGEGDGALRGRGARLGRPPPPRPDPLDAEIAGIALPMLATLAAEPLSALTNTAFLGQLGASHLAAASAGLSIFASVSKLLQVPLLSIATTSVASARGAAEAEAAAAAAEAAAEATTAEPAEQGGKAHDLAEGSAEQQQQQQRQQPAVSSSSSTADDAVSSAASAALVSAGLVGAAAGAALLAFAPGLLALWGVPRGSPLYASALDFLTLRALGAPVSVVLVVAAGCFRGLADARTPFYATLGTNALNIALDAALIFGAGWGVRGAALATVLAQMLPCAWLLGRLSRRCELRFTGRGALRAMANLAAPTAFLAVRTGALTATYAVATALTVRAGAEAAAANSLCLQLWLSSSLLADALAVAAQSLVARCLAAGRPGEARRVVRRTAALALALGVALAGLLAAGAGPLPRLFSGDPAVLGLSRGVWAFVVLSQPLNAAAFVYDGVLFGAPNGFKFAAVSMAASCAPAVVLMQLVMANGSGSGGAGLAGGAAAAADSSLTLSAVWAGLTLLMGLRWATIALPYRLRLGPFAAFKDLEGRGQ